MEIRGYNVVHVYGIVNTASFKSANRHERFSSHGTHSVIGKDNNFIHSQIFDKQYLLQTITSLPFQTERTVFIIGH